MFGRFKTPERSRSRRRATAPAPAETATPSTMSRDALDARESLQAIEDRLDELATRESKTAALIVRFERASEAARTATAEMASAREERDQY